MLEVFTAALLLPMLMILSVPIFIYLYVILRWRAAGTGEPGIGAYSLVLTFRTLAILLATGALATLLYTMLSEEEHETLSRACWGLLWAAAIFGAGHIPAGLALKPAADVSAARRLFGGGLLTIAGLVTFAALIFLMITLFEKVPEESEPFFERRGDDHSDKLKAAGSWLFCFGAVYAGQAAMMARSARTPK